VPGVGWFKVQPEVAKFTRVCSYDRAGYGLSDPGPEPRTSLQMANELKTFLGAAGEREPYVLVGHSLRRLHGADFQPPLPRRRSGRRIG
jgi:pimeloyl-ACP methyl ester carboxylesterase